MFLLISAWRTLEGYGRLSDFLAANVCCLALPDTELVLVELGPKVFHSMQKAFLSAVYWG